MVSFAEKFDKGMSINEQIAWYDETLKLLITIKAPFQCGLHQRIPATKTIITKRRVTMRKASGPVYIGEQILSNALSQCALRCGNCYAGACSEEADLGSA